MTNVNNWTQDAVIKKYQSEKQSVLRTFEHNIEFQHMHKECSNASYDGIYSLDTLFKIAANIKVQIESIHVTFEELQQKFSIGLLLPSIEVSSMNEFWEHIKVVTFTDILFKKLSIKSVSLFINTGDKFKPFTNIIDTSRIDELDAAGKESIREQVN